MKRLNSKQLKQITGGSISFGASLFIGGLVTFFIGLVDGFLRPLACRS